MIRYSLACDAGHLFETWFRDSNAFEDQAARHLVECPTCRSSAVAKAIMAPAVLSGRQAPRDMAEVAIAAPVSAPTSLLDQHQAVARAFGKAIRDRILAEVEDVGAEFPREARRIHDGESPSRPIHGQASRDEAIDLLEDGILVLPLPALPEQLN